MDKLFAKFANAIARATGSPIAFLLCVTAVVIWAVSGPIFKFSETWQLVINTGTTIVTFLMVFLIQNSQNRDTRAIQLKLDELLRVVENARQGRFMNLEDETEETLDQVKQELEQKCREGESPIGHERHAAAA